MVTKRKAPKAHRAANAIRIAELKTAEEAQLQQGGSAAQFVGDGGHGGEHGNGEQGDDGSRAPAQRVRLDDRVDQAAEHDDHQQLAQGVGTKGPRCAGLRNVPSGHRDRDRHDRHVDPEDGASAERVDQPATEDRTEGQRQAGHRAEHTDGLGTLLRIGECGGDYRHRHRVEHGAAYGLHRAGSDEPALASPAGRLDPAVLAALDEAPNIAPIPSLRQRVADGRGRGITVVYGLQAWASARARFGEDTAKELAAFTNNVIVLPGDKDPDFLKDMSDLCGQVERERTTKTTSGGDRGGHSTATHMALEPVLRGDEIRGLPAGHALVLADNLPPIVTRLDGMWTWDSWSELESHVRDLRAADEAERTRRAAEKRNQAKAHAAAWAGREGAAAA